jgi:hypothetical protein
MARRIGLGCVRRNIGSGAGRGQFKGNSDALDRPPLRVGDLEDEGIAQRLPYPAAQRIAMDHDDSGGLSVAREEQLGATTARRKKDCD